REKNASDEFLRSLQEIMAVIVQKLLKFVFWILACITTPFYRLRYFKKRKRLPPIKSPLLLQSATKIAQQIRERKVSCVSVIRAYIERCNDVNPIITAIVDTRYESAIQEAKGYDEFLARTEKTTEELAREMPLLGVPVTVKESIAVKGMCYTVGFKENVPTKAEEDAEAVSLIRKAGAIILLVSNTPEMCLFWESNNNVTGCTNNPYDPRKTSGGSSGGEGALSGSAASVVSLVSDIAGSARFPALFCGVFGHKPTPNLVAIKGHKPISYDVRWNEFFVMGTIARYAEDLPLVISVMCKTDEGRRRLNQKTPLANIKFFYTEGRAAEANSINRDMKNVMQKLRTYLEVTYSVKVQQVHMSDIKYSFNLSAYALLNLDVEEVVQEFGPLNVCALFVEGLKQLFRVSRYTFAMYGYLMAAYIYRKLPRGFSNLMAEKRVSLKKQFEDILGDNGVMIYPSFVSAAYYRYESFNNIPNFAYMMLFNVLGLPVTQCPMGLNANGLPLGLQIVAGTGNDHLSIAVAQEIDRIFGGWRQPPCSSGEESI
ncbi:fatty-acid amide hydrolase 2, partial [Hylaeus anthracinus]|uniref:fatty-acid amide hydrolase 2 n=1 Tax=Hylaeus anthracinus TaxID=313031 RepID=UPI0023B911CE